MAKGKNEGRVERAPLVDSAQMSELPTAAAAATSARIVAVGGHGWRGGWARAVCHGRTLAAGQAREQGQCDGATQQPPDDSRSQVPHLLSVWDVSADP